MRKYACQYILSAAAVFTSFQLSWARGVSVEAASTWSASNIIADSKAAAQFERKCGGDWRTLIKIWEQRQISAMSGDTSVQLVVYRCHDICGGLGDRQRGILTSFLLALVTSRAFFVENEHPIALRHYFQFANPQLSWVFTEDLLVNRSVLDETFMDSHPDIGDYAEANLSRYDPYDVIFQRNNYWKPLSVLLNPGFERPLKKTLPDDHILAGCFLNYLLAPQRHIVLQVQRVIRQQKDLQKDILAVQIRSGDNQAKNESVIEDLSAVFLNCVRQIQNASSTKYTVFLTTDSEQIGKRFSSAIPDLLTFTGPILHLDGFFGASETPDVAFQKVLLDHIMLSAAQELVISRSGFAEFAALRGFQAYRHPHQCDIVMHYSFPAQMPAGVPAGELNSVMDILKPSFDSRAVR